MKYGYVLVKILPFLFMLSLGSVTAQIRVDDSSFSDQQLIEDVLIDSPCARVENIISSTGTSVGVNGIGYFEANGSGFQIERGIVLSTGNAASAMGPNGIEPLSEGGETWRGDNDLGRITNTSPLFNATYIQFDFIPSIDFITFDFLFASEEYVGIFPCIFSDVFAFILTDSSGNSRNLAVVPGTNPPTAIKVTTVNAGVDLNNDGDFEDTIEDQNECPPRNQEFFGRVIAPGTDAPIDFNGYTKVLKASGSVIPNERYTIKMVIADNLDPGLDSAVFLAAGSFNIGGDLGEDRTIANGNPGCEGTPIILNATVGSSSSYFWFKDGTPVGPGDGTTVLDGGARLEVTQDGFYSVDIDVSGLCSSSDSVGIEFATPPAIISLPNDLDSCDLDNDGISLFDLTTNTALVLGGQNPTIYEVSYHLTQEDAENYTGVSSTNTITNPSGFMNTSAIQTIWLRIAESTQTCYKVTSFTIESIPVEAIILEERYVRCLNADGSLINIFPQDIEVNLDTSQYTFQWYIGTQAIAGNEIIGETNATFFPDASGQYSVEVTHVINGCSISKSINVEDSYPPEGVRVEVISGAFSNNVTVEVFVEGNGNYEFQIDDSDWQTSSIFNGVTIGEHTITVRDIDRCGEESTIINVTSGYPEYFTPNGDGFHDVWNIESTRNVTINQVLIFDRFGRLLKTLGSQSNWDGTSQGRQLPSSEYWFKVLYTEQGVLKEFKSSFTLLR